MSIKYVRTIVLILLCSTGYQFRAHCQLYFPEDMVNVKGQLIDEITKEGVGYVQVLNMRVRGGTMSDALGNFSIQADPSDTLSFKSLSYKSKRVAVSEILSAKNGIAKILLSPIRILLNQVDVESTGPKVNMNGIPVGKSVSTPIELRSDYFATKPKVLSAIFQPISFLSYHLSKSEKEKRATITAIHTERDYQLLALVYNKDVIQRVSGFTGKALEDFMLYCNAFNNLLINANSYDVEKRIRELMVEFVVKYPQGR